MAAASSSPLNPPNPPPASHGPLLARDLLDLPTELLADILGRLPVAELVRARQVCRRVRAVVELLREQDRAHYFRCGAADALSIAQLPYTRVAEVNEGYATPCTCGVILWKRESVKQLVRMRSGAPVTADENDYERERREEHEREDAEVAARPYAARHDVGFPPARWALLAADRAIALEIAQQCAKVDLRLILRYGMQQGVDGGPYPFVGWLPFVLRLPDTVRRPTTSRGLFKLVDSVLDHGEVRLNGQHGTPDGAATLAALFDKLSSKDSALAFYNRSRRGWATYSDADSDDAPTEEHWREAWQFRTQIDRHAETAERDPAAADDDFDDDEVYGDAELAAAVECFGRDHQEAAEPDRRDPSGWTWWQFRARQLAANWRCSMAEGRMRAFRYYRLGGSGEFDQMPFAGMSTEAVTAYLDGNVHAVDAAHALVTARCPLSAVVEMDGPVDGHSWVVVAGLSAAGHLVGALSGTSQCKYW